MRLLVQLLDLLVFVGIHNGVLMDIQWVIQWSIDKLVRHDNVCGIIFHKPIYIPKPKSGKQ